MTTQKQMPRIRFSLARTLLVIGIFAGLFAYFRSLEFYGLFAALVVGTCASGLVLTQVTFRRAFILVILAWTAIAIVLASTSGGWGALGMTVFVGPGVNLIAAILGVIYIAIRRTNDETYELTKPLATVLGSPLGSVVMILVGTAITGPHGGC
jgi:hypothetical protein